MSSFYDERDVRDANIVTSSSELGFDGSASETYAELVNEANVPITSSELDDCVFVGAPTTADLLQFDEYDSEHRIVSLMLSEENVPRKPWLAAILLLPAHAAVGVLSILAGAGAARRAGASPHGAALSGAMCGVLLRGVLGVLRSGDFRRRQIEIARARNANDGVGWGEAVQAVARMVGRFSDGLSVPSGLKYLLLLDRKLVLLYHREKGRQLAGNARKRARSSARVLQLGRRYCGFAMATYGYALLRALGMLDAGYDWRERGTRAVEVAMHQLRLQKEDMLAARLDGDAIGVPRHFVCVDAETRAIVVAIRGTSSMADLITDLLCEAAPFGAGVAHKGMRDSAAALLAAITPTVRVALRARPTYSLVVCGHSLGAGVALLLTKMLLNAGFSSVKCYAFAPCPVFGPYRRIDTEWSDAVECFVHHDDLVAQLSLSSARRLALEIERVDGIHVDHQQLRKCADERRRLTDEIDRRRRAAVRLDPREHVIQQLYIPTRSGVHWLLPDEREERRGWRFWQRRGRAKVEEEFPHFPWHNWNLPRANRPRRKYSSFITGVESFERLLVTPRSIVSHFPHRYVAAFASLPIAPPPLEPCAVPPPTHKVTEMYYGELGPL